MYRQPPTPATCGAPGGPPLNESEPFRNQLIMSGNKPYLTSANNVTVRPLPKSPPQLQTAISHPDFNGPATMSSQNSQTLRWESSGDRTCSTEFTFLAQRAALRNASGGFGAELKPSEDCQSRIPDNILSITSPSPQVTIQLVNCSQEVSLASPSFALQAAPTRAERAARSRHVNREPVFGSGLSSSMPSQLTHNPQEFVATSRQYQARVRQMQRTLASDPNVVVTRAPGSAMQLTAVGPPLTGHDALTITTLPSVLNPISRQPMMTYEGGLQAILGETGGCLFRLTQLEPRAVSVVLYDTLGRPIKVSEGLVLTKETDIKAVVTLIQELLDDACANEPVHDGSRLIVKVVEIRVGITDGTQGYPPLEGTRVGGERAKWAKWVKWAVVGDMEKYWDAYRIMLQTQGAPKKGSTTVVTKPIFKVRTVRQENNNGLYPGGHEFYNVSDTVLLPHSAVQPYGHGHEDDCVRLEELVDGGADASSEISNGNFAFASDMTSHSVLTEGMGQLQLFDGAASISGSQDGHSGSDGSEAPAPAPEATVTKAKVKPVDPTRNWGYYQRMGGDPRYWKLYDLSHIPFDVDPENLPAPIPELFTIPDILVTIRDRWSDNGTDGSLTPKVSDGPADIIYIEKAWLAYKKKQFEKAISFDDDDVFFPNADIILPSQNDLLNSRLAGHLNHTRKARTKETDATNFFNGHYAPHGSQDHLLGFSGYDIVAHCSDGNVQEVRNSSPYSGYATPEGHHNPFGFAGYDVPQYEGKEYKEIDESSKASKPYTYPISSYGNSKSSMIQSPMAAEVTTSASKDTSRTRVSSMNVHAAPFPSSRQPQLGQGSESNMRSPYLQSISDSQAAVAYTRSSPHSQMTGQPRSKTPILRFPSPSMTSNEGAAVKKSNFALSNQAYYPQQSDSVPFKQSPETTFWRRASPEKSMLSSLRKFSSPRHESLAKYEAANTAGHFEQMRHSPDKQSSKKKHRRSRVLGSPDKLLSGEQDAVQAGILRLPSSDKPNSQQGSGGEMQYPQKINTSTALLQYPSFDSFNAQQGPNSSFGSQYGHSSQQSFDFSFQAPFHTSGNISGQGMTQSGSQGFPHNGGQGQKQGSGQAPAGGQASVHGGSQVLSRGGSWIYRGGKMPKQEFGF